MNPQAIFTTFNQTEAQMVRSQLEIAGFHPFVANTITAANLGGLSTATLIRVEVPETEAEEAKAFLAAPPIFPNQE